MDRVIAVQNETNATTSRTTRDGRKITYKLKVLQQPERARACGSGAKSSADRRPVDPPPIVELRIYEGENEEKDVTFQLSANYFLFATLENARHIAQGRVPQDAARATVLTGTPVAGMVYLDRPEPAGYFIFPDLSVRHEGKYRLGFSLYEELKDTKDSDRVDDNGLKTQGLGQAEVTHRLEVRSLPFVVYSAKKFPGLTSSTSLSRTVAEQGCRVRIRRDVRMRRREKPGKDGYDGYSDSGYDRARHSSTPDMYQQHLQAANHGMIDPSCRERSASIASHVSLVGSQDARRTSMQEMPHTYQQPAYAPAPVVPQAAQPAPLSQPQYGAQLPPQYQPHYQYQQAPMPPPQIAYQNGYQYAQPPVAAPQQHYHYSQQPQQAVAQYDGHAHARNHSIDYAASSGTDSRRSSGMVPPPTYSYGQQNQAAHTQYPPHTSSYSMPTAREAAHGPPPSMLNPIAMPQQILPPINPGLQARDSKLEPSAPSSIVSPSRTFYGSGPKQQMGDSGSHVGQKRAYARVFNTEHMNGPLRQGARPNSDHIHSNGQTLEATHDDGGLKMMYRRADGREIERPLPPSI
ncbi:velvet factor-domain-containing protein [Delphinella strobiligena]|nr:velvet factor-domain-containing protein [Delphinella strobiligena]